MAKKTKRRNDRLSKRKVSRRRYSKHKYSKRRVSKMAKRNRLKRSMRGGSSTNPARTDKEEQIAMEEALRQSMMNLPLPVRAAGAAREGTYLCIMRHSLRLDEELDKINKEYIKTQEYYKQGYVYNTPLAMNSNMKPEIYGVDFTGKDAFRRLLLSIKDDLKKSYNFRCIITSPFTRCLQTADIVRQNLKIDRKNIYVNFNLREDDLAIARCLSEIEDKQNIKYKADAVVGDQIWNTLEPYDTKLIHKVAQGGIEPYVKQTLDEIFDNYKYLGDVLIITHSDTYNRYVPELPGVPGVGSSKLEEAGWAIFKPPSKEFVAKAGAGFFTDLSV